MTTEAPYTVRRVEQLSGLPRTTVTALVAAGFVAPSRGARNELRFTFQDLLLLRTAQALRKARLPTRRILRALRKLRDDLPDAMPLTGLQIVAVADQVAVRQGAATWDAETGQLLLSFDREAASGAIMATAQGAPSAGTSRLEDALDCFDRAVSLECTQRLEAESAYRQAIALDPCFEDAYINLGALLCEVRRCDEAIALYEQARRHCDDAPLIHFNGGIALEDQGRIGEAIRAYEEGLHLDPALADAHYNIAVLRERNGDSRGALRHFNAYRRLQRETERATQCEPSD